VSTTTENVIPLLSAYKAMSIETNGTSSTSGSTSTSPVSYSYTESYNTIYASSTTYKVAITSIEGGQNITETVWLLRNGTALAINIEGQNLTGSFVQEELVGVFAGFTLQVQADSYIGLYTSSNYFHSTGTSTVSIGPTQVSVTTYSANTLPETVSGCGTTSTLTAYAFSVGTPKGAALPLVTYEHFAGSDIVNGQTQTYDYVLQVTSITLA
jgi:hypothetical protein